MNIFVAKLSPSTTSESLRELFEEYGEVSSANVIIDRETGRSKRFGFVEMDDDNEANTAIEGLNEVEFEDSQIVVQEAKPRENNDRRGGGGGGYRGGGGGDRRGGGGYGGGGGRDRY
ncbi:RNA-binding protein [Candidatus Kapabacteria bacterium]|nr:RNA-binding protein [Candidatus Kapabacteria bacterium]